MSTLFYVVGFVACIVTAIAGALCMRWRMARSADVSDHEDPRDTQIRNLLGEVQMARNDMKRSRTIADEATEHVELAHETIHELKRRTASLGERIAEFESHAGERSNELELLTDKLSAANQQLNTLKHRNQELEIELSAVNPAEDMLDPLQQHVDDNHEDDGDELEAFRPFDVDDTSSSLLESLTIELERWKKHCHVLGDELKIQRERLAQLGESTETDENPFDSIDELTDIRGIGNAIARKLHQLGIYRYRELASLSGDDVERARMLIPNFDSRMARDNWQDQARSLHRDKYEESL
jgi:predicted flap endonuclease-1-like 5' DNA nuclease